MTNKIGMGSNVMTGTAFFRKSITALGTTLCLSTAVSAQDVKEGGTMIMIVNPEPPTLASYLSTSGPIGQVSTKVYDGLLEYDANLNPQPGLAESFEISEDGLTITFKLREGVTFHDGTVFDSADVEFSIEEVLIGVHPRAANTFRELKDITTPDGQTVVMHLKNPAPYLIRALSGYETPMLSMESFEGTDFRENPTANAPVGTGPFKFVEWERGQYIRLDKNEDYWKDGRPYLDRIVARFIPDAGTRAAALESGEVQYAAFNAVLNVDAKRLDAMESLSVTSEGYSMINPLMLLEVNTKSAPMDNTMVRQAVSYAIDRQFIIDRIFFGYGTPATGSISSNFAPTGLYSDKVRDYAAEDRIDHANSLLDEAGFPRGDDGVRFEIVHDILPYGESWQRMGEYLKQSLGDVGIKVTLRYEDVPTWLKRIYTDYDYQLNSTFFYQLADPVLGMHRQYLTSEIRPGTVFVNGAQYSNPKLDDLMAAGSTEPDPAARSAIYDEIQALLAEDVPVIPLVEMDFITVHSSNLDGTNASPLGVYSSFDSAGFAK
jgi:peptide/nickel transport system substrate-binding protein